MKVIIFGATGFIGSRLQEVLKEKGHSVAVADVRHEGWQNELSSVDAVVNLGGTPLFGKRWNSDYKTSIYESRVEGTHKIVEAMGRVHKSSGKPAKFVSASAIGFYGTSMYEIFDEGGTQGGDFLAMVCNDWEEAARQAQQLHHIDTTIVRFGIVLGEGGALKTMLPPLQNGNRRTDRQRQAVDVLDSH
jgi:uncharacterized protein